MLRPIEQNEWKHKFHLHRKVNKQVAGVGQAVPLCASPPYGTVIPGLTLSMGPCPLTEAKLLLDGVMHFNSLRPSDANMPRQINSIS